MKDKAENIITTELAKQNVTEAVIAKLKADYLPLKINGIDDKVGYKKVHDARIVCRDHRTLTEKICKLGREDAIKIQKEWIAKEKEVVAQISEVEQHLKKQEDAIDKIIEDQKIRAERLLKLPGRKEQLVGLENFIDKVDDTKTILFFNELGKPLTDDIIMRCDDLQWNQYVLGVKEKKFDAQQKVIDDHKAKELLEKTILRENELIAAGATLYSDGLGKVYRKGSASVNEATIKSCIDEGWGKIVEVFQNAVVTPNPEQTGHSVPAREGVVPSRPPVKDISDEEKLWNYATALELVTCAKLNTPEADKTLKKAESILLEILTLLRN